MAPLPNNSLTRCTAPAVQAPIKFLGATVLSINASMGWGVDSSSLDVELIEDEFEGVQLGWDTLNQEYKNYVGKDSFLGKTQEIIGGAAYFSLPPPNANEPWNKFFFGGIITNWTYKDSGGAKTYNVKLSDPKPVLEHVTLITDTYSDLPYQHYNYYNVFAAYEASVHAANCAVFGRANSTARGMNYNNIIRALLAFGWHQADPFGRPLAFSNTAPNITVNSAGRFKVDLGLLLEIFPLTTTPPFSDITWHTSKIYVNPNRLLTADGLPIPLANADNLPIGPSDYKITGSLSLLELINNICELTGRSFYTNLVYDFKRLENVIVVSTVKFEPVSSYGYIQGAFSGVATDISYGKELKNDKNRKIIFGDSVHYLNTTTSFIPFFGENDAGQAVYPLMDSDGNFIGPFDNAPSVDGQVDDTQSGCGFWIKIDANKLNITLKNPLVSPIADDGKTLRQYAGVDNNGDGNIDTADTRATHAVALDYFWLSENDIRSAMAGQDMFKLRMLSLNNNPAFNKANQNLRANAPGAWYGTNGVATLPENEKISRKSLINVIQQTPFYDPLSSNFKSRIENILTSAGSIDPITGVFLTNDSPQVPFGDMIHNANLPMIQQELFNISEDLDKIFKFIQDIGQTYYGKQFLTQLTEPICANWNNEEAGGQGFGEQINSSSPTNAGGWVDYGTSVLGLSDPGLQVFRKDDDRVRCFARFNNFATYNTGFTEAYTYRGEPAPGEVDLNKPLPKNP